MVLMFQREVAERIVAVEDDEAYGRLGVLSNWRAETKILFDISPAAFHAATEGDVIGGAAGAPHGARGLRTPPAGAGGGRRLQPTPQDAAAEPEVLGADPARLAAAADVDATRRAETVPVSGFVAMARELPEIRKTKSITPTP